MTEEQEYFAGWCRHLRGGCPRASWAKSFGLNERALQDLEQGRSLPSRALVVLLKAIETSPDFARHIAKEARPELELLDAQRGNRNKYRRVPDFVCGPPAISTVKKHCLTKP